MSACVQVHLLCPKKSPCKSKRRQTEICSVKYPPNGGEWTKYIFKRRNMSKKSPCKSKRRQTEICPEKNPPKGGSGQHISSKDITCPQKKSPCRSKRRQTEICPIKISSKRREWTTYVCKRHNMSSKKPLQKQEKADRNLSLICQKVGS